MESTSQINADSFVAGNRARKLRMRHIGLTNQAHPQPRRTRLRPGKTKRMKMQNNHTQNCKGSGCWVQRIVRCLGFDSAGVDFMALLNGKSLEICESNTRKKRIPRLRQRIQWQCQWSTIREVFHTTLFRRFSWLAPRVLLHPSSRSLIFCARRASPKKQQLLGCLDKGTDYQTADCPEIPYLFVTSLFRACHHQYKTCRLLGQTFHLVPETKIVSVI